MTKIKVEEKLNTIREENRFDDGFLDILNEANSNDESAEETAKKVIEEIKKRYDENKEN